MGSSKYPAFSEYLASSNAFRLFGYPPKSVVNSDTGQHGVGGAGDEVPAFVCDMSNVIRTSNWYVLLGKLSQNDYAISVECKLIEMRTMCSIYRVLWRFYV